MFQDFLNVASVLDMIFSLDNEASAPVNITVIPENNKELPSSPSLTRSFEVYYLATP